MLTPLRFPLLSSFKSVFAPLLVCACSAPQSSGLFGGSTASSGPVEVSSLGPGEVLDAAIDDAPGGATIDAGAPAAGVSDGSGTSTATDDDDDAVTNSTPSGSDPTNEDDNADENADPNCAHQRPRPPSVVSPVSGAEGVSRTAVALQSSQITDADDDALVAVQWEIRENDGSNDPPIAWSGIGTGTDLELSAGAFIPDGDTAFKFGQDYIIRLRHQDSGPCNNVSEWSSPVGFTTDDGGDAFFDPNIVRRIDITIPTENGSPSSWELIDAEAEVDGCVNAVRNYYEGSVKFEGATYAGVGLRAKGGCGSSRSLDQKTSFKINLGWDPDPTDEVCPRTRRIHSKQRITLNAGVQDDTAMHEHLTFQLYRAAGVPAPRTASIQVYVNGEYFGLYQNIETVDRSLLNRWFDSSQGKGMMYEGAYRCDFFGGNNDPMTDGYCWEREFEVDRCDADPDVGDDLQRFETDGETPYDPWTPARQLEASLESIRDSASFFPSVQTLIDWDRFLTYWAVSAVVIDWDNYVYNRNNFRFYHDVPSDLWVFLPWGVDQTWVPRNGRSGQIAFEPVADLPNFCLNATGSDGTGTCKDRYAQALIDVLQLFESTDWQAEIDTWQARLDPYIQLEGDRRSYDYEEWLEAVAGLREFANTRANQVRNELNNAGYSLP